jgi:hypothetical protein
MTMGNQSFEQGEYGTGLEYEESQQAQYRFGGDQMQDADDLGEHASGGGFNLYGYHIPIGGRFQRDLLLILAGAALGAGLMYVLDPTAGRRRRALARDKAVHLGHVASCSLRGTTIAARNKARGLAARVRSGFRRDEASDNQLEARVRSALGRAVSHPGAISVASRDGCVTLSGQVLASELDGLLSTVGAVRGITSVENHLQVHDNPGHVPGLQG